MKLIFALIFVVLTTVAYAQPLDEDFTDVEKEEGNIQPNDGADELSDHGDDEENLEEDDDGDDDDDDDDSTENDEDARRYKKKPKCTRKLRACLKGKEKNRKARRRCYRRHIKCLRGNRWSG